MLNYLLISCKEFEEVTKFYNKDVKKQKFNGTEAEKEQQYINMEVPLVDVKIPFDTGDVQDQEEE